MTAHASTGTTFVIDATSSAYAGGVKADYSTDDTAALNAALTAAFVDVPTLSGNDDAARIVQLPPGRIKIQGTIVVPANVHLRGHGAAGTYLIRQAGGTGTAVVTTTGVQNILSDFGVIVNDNAVDGISFGQSGASILGDARQVCRDVIVVGGRDGFVSLDSQANEIRLTRCASYRTARHGFHFNTNDGFLEGCTAAGAGTGNVAAYGSNAVGFYISGFNWRIYGCKAFGQLGTFGGGFATGDRCQVVGCEAQDNQAGGFAFASNNGQTTAAACLSDSNGGKGFQLIGDVSLVGCQSIVRGGGLYTTGEAISISPVNGIGPKVRGFSQSGCTRLYWHDATILEGGSFDMLNRYGAQTIAYAATVTPDPWAGQDVLIGSLTGNITIANPSTSPDGSGTPYPKGMELCFELAQDATGGRTVTLGTNYKTTGAVSTTASTTTMIRFKYDGLLWREVARAVT